MSRDFTVRTGQRVHDIKILTALEGRESLRIGYAKTLRTRKSLRSRDVAGSEADFRIIIEMTNMPYFKIAGRQKRLEGKVAGR